MVIMDIWPDFLRLKFYNKFAKEAVGADLPIATPPIGQTDPFSKIVVTFKPTIRFGCPWQGVPKTLVFKYYLNSWTE